MGNASIKLGGEYDIIYQIGIELPAYFIEGKKFNEYQKQLVINQIDNTISTIVNFLTDQEFGLRFQDPSFNYEAFKLLDLKLLIENRLNKKRPVDPLGVGEILVQMINTGFYPSKILRIRQHNGIELSEKLMTIE